MESPDTYLGVIVSKMNNTHDNSCRAMSSDQYCSALVTDIEDELQTKDMRLPCKCPSSFSHGYKPEMDCTTELNTAGVQRFQEIVRSLR